MVTRKGFLTGSVAMAAATGVRGALGAVNKAGDGEAFWAGVYSKGAARGRGGIEPRTASVPDGEYRWYDVLTWVPAPDEFFWVGPGRFNADGKSAINGVYIDKIKFEEVPDSP